MGIEMKRKEQTKTFMMISNSKNLWFLGLYIFLTARLAAPEVSDRALLNQCYDPPIGVGRMI